MIEKLFPDSSLLDIISFSRILNKRYLTNSYKIYWMYGLLEEVKNDNRTIPFKRLVAWMVAKSWYSILNFKLKLGHQDFLFKIVHYVYENSSLNIKSEPLEIVNFIENTNDETLIKLIKHFYKFVPNRILTPFYYKELKNIPESKRSRFLIEQSQTNCKFYKINVANESLSLSENWWQYIKENSVIIEGWILSNLVVYLQARNPATPAIINKIYPPRKRNLKNAIEFWKYMCNKLDVRDIYTLEEIKLNDFSLDHFIPWSFVLHDQIWNLIPVSRAINSSKNDRLPQLSKYFSRFAELQYNAFHIALEVNYQSRLLEDYLTLSGVELKKDFPKQRFIVALERTIKPLYQIAINQGFEIWEI